MMQYIRQWIYKRKNSHEAHSVIREFQTGPNEKGA
jgi:hypothetical protein